MTIGAALLVFIVLQRLTELAIAAANTRRLKALGAIEIDAPGYKWIVILHVAWLSALLFELPMARSASWPLLGIFVLLQLARAWVIGTLGRRWTTRIIMLPHAPLVQNGPYRVVRHPNYLIVAIEIVVVPLAFGAIATAAIFGLANAALLTRRIAIEDRALRSGG